MSDAPLANTGELARIRGESPSIAHRALTDLWKMGLVGRVSHGTAHLRPSYRYFLSYAGIEEARMTLGYRSVSEYLHARRISREWLRVLIRRGDAVGSYYRLAATLSPGAGGLGTHVAIHRSGRRDATITLHDGRSFGVVRQGLGLKKAGLNLRLRAIHKYDDYERRPATVLVLTPNRWERDLTAEYWQARAFQDGYVATENAITLTRPDLPVWRRINNVTGGECNLYEIIAKTAPDSARLTASPEYRLASMPDPRRMVREAPTFGFGPSAKVALDIITAYPMIRREALARWLAVSLSRLNQSIKPLTRTWGLVERRGRRGDIRYTLSDRGIRYVTYRDRTTLEAAQAIWSAAPAEDPKGKRLYAGHLIDTWARQTAHADGIAELLSLMAAETRDASGSALLWVAPEWRSERKYHWNRRSITPDAVGVLIADRTRIPFFLEYERRARHPAGVRQKLGPYARYYRSSDIDGDMPPFPITLFVVDSEDVESTYVATAAAMGLSLPILVSSKPALARAGILGRSWRLLWEPDSPRRRLADLARYAFSRLDRRMSWAG